MESMKENEGECSCFFLEVLQTCPKYVLDISRPTLFHDQVTVLCAFIIIKCLKAYHKRTANWNRFSLHNASHRLNKSQYSVEKATSLCGASALRLLAWGLASIYPMMPTMMPHSAMLRLIQNFPREMKPSLRFWHGIIELRNALQASRCGMICQDVHNRDSLCYFHSHMLRLVLTCRTWHAWLIRKHSNCSQAVKMQLQFIHWYWQIFNPGLLKFSSIIVIILCKWSARWRSGTKSCRKYLLQHQVMLSHAVSSTSSDSGSLTFSFTTFSSWKRRVQQSLDGNFEKFHHGIYYISNIKDETWNKDMDIIAVAPYLWSMILAHIACLRSVYTDCLEYENKSAQPKRFV